MDQSTKDALADGETLYLLAKQYASFKTNHAYDASSFGVSAGFWAQCMKNPRKAADFAREAARSAHLAVPALREE